MKTCLAGLFTLGILTLQAISPNHFPYQKQLQENNKKSGDFAIVPFDVEMYRTIDNLSTDLRFFSTDGQELPFQVLLEMDDKQKSRDHFTLLSSKLLSFQKENNTATVILENTSEPRREAIKITVETNDSDFEKQIAVYAGNDLKTWKRLGPDQPFFDYRSKINLRNTSALFPETDARYFKLVISNFRESSEAPRKTITSGDVNTTQSTQLASELQIDSVLLYAPQIIPPSPKLNEVKALQTAKRNESTKKRTVITFQTNREPLSELRITSSTPRYQRSVLIEGQNDDQSYTILTRGVIERFSFRQYHDQQSIIPLQSRYRNYRLTIDNQDDPPLSDINISLRHRQYNAILHPLPSDGAAIYYGNPAKRPNYDLAATLNHPGSSNATFKHFTALPQVNNSAYSGPEQPFNYRPLLFAVLILAGLVLGFFLFKSIGKIEKIQD